jgi:hypothetical protein
MDTDTNADENADEEELANTTIETITSIASMDCLTDSLPVSPWGPASAVGTSRHTRN